MYALIPSWLRAYADRNLIMVGLLGLASGLPYLLVGSTLGVWLQETGESRSTIGMFAWVAIPYSLNFLWAPLMDHWRLGGFTRKLGRRRSWLLIWQCALVGSLLILASISPEISLTVMALGAVLVAFCSAGQDVVIDAYRAEILEESQYGEGAAIAVFGYRIGMLGAGAGALFLAEVLPWQMVYLCMAAIMVGAIIVTLIAQEPEEKRTVCDANIKPTHPITVSPSDDGVRMPSSDGVTHSALNESRTSRYKNFFRTAIVAPFKDFTQTHRNWLLILLFILAYRIPDGFIGFMVNPFLRDIGFAKSDIATVAKLYGFGATMAGMFIGGALMRILGIYRCLGLFMLFQIAANLTYIGLVSRGPDLAYLSFAIGLDNLSGGMITGVAIAYMMTLINKAHTATQYALLASLASLSSKVLAGSAGILADAYGWSAMFAASAAMGVPALILWWIVRKR